MTTMATPEERADARATIREVLALVERVRRDVLAEVDKLESKVDARLEAHAAKHDADAQTHQVEHRRDTDRHTGYLRWAVTTIITGAGVLLSIYLALRS